MTDEVKNVDEVKEITRALIRIVYRSGHVYEGWFDKMKVEYSNGDLVNLSWAPSPSNQDKFLFVGIKDIESITQLDAYIVAGEA
jgi:hypothetical protein